jgi:hypothetical protein
VIGLGDIIDKITPLNTSHDVNYTVLYYYCSSTVQIIFNNIVVIIILYIYNIQCTFCS